MISKLSKKWDDNWEKPDVIDWMETVKIYQLANSRTIGEEEWIEVNNECEEESKKMTLRMLYAHGGDPEIKELNNQEDICKVAMNGYSDKIIALIRKIKAIIYYIHKTYRQGQNLRYNIIQIWCKMNEEEFPLPIFRVYAGIDHKNDEVMCRYVDISCRIYKDFDDWKKNNILPRMKYCYPRNGLYTCSGDKTYKHIPNEFPDIEFGNSPACKKMARAGKVLDVFATAASVGAIGASIATIFVTFPPVGLIASSVVVAGSTTYCGARSVNTLVDKKKHEDSLTDFTAIMCWISALTTPLGLATPAFHISAALNAQHNLQLYANLGNIGHSAVASLSSTTLSINATFLIPGFANLFRKFCQGTLQFADKLKFSISILYFSNVLIQAKTIDDVLIKIRQNKFENISAPLVTEEMELAAKDLAKFMNLLSKKKARAVKQMIPNGSSQTDAQMIEIVEDYQSIEYTDGNSRTQMTVDIEIAQECIPSNENKSSKKKILEETQAITSLLPTTIKLCQRIEKEQISKNKSENIKKGSSSIDIIRTVKLKNGKIQMPSDIIMALKIDIRENIGMKDPVKAGHHYRKYQEDYPKRLPKVIHIYLEETSGVLLKDAKMICIHTKSDGTKVSAYELSDEQFGILVETSNGLKVASSFVHPDSLKNITNNLKNIPITDDFTPAEIPEYVKAMTESLGLYKVDVEIKTDGSTTKNIFEFLDQSPNEQYYAEIARILKAMTLDKKYYSSKS